MSTSTYRLAGAIMHCIIPPPSPLLEINEANVWVCRSKSPKGNLGEYEVNYYELHYSCRG